MDGHKRKADGAAAGSGQLKKQKKQWASSKKNYVTQAVIQAGDAGIWATCNKGRERKCTRELQDLLQEYAEKLYPADAGGSNKTCSAKGGEDEDDLETSIQAEISGMEKPKDSLFKPIDTGSQCVVFIKTTHPVDPVTLVDTICRDLHASRKPKTRNVLRLIPVAKIGRATEAAFEELAESIVRPHFPTAEDSNIRWRMHETFRQHEGILKKDYLMQRLPEIVGLQHKVKLTGESVGVLVEVYRHTVGMSVVPADYHELRKYNVAEICAPSASGIGSAANVASKSSKGDLAAAEE